MIEMPVKLHLKERQAEVEADQTRMEFIKMHNLVLLSMRD